MKINKIFTAIAMTVLLVGCSAEDELATSWRSDADAVKINLSVAGHQTGSRSNPVADIDKEGDVTQFNEGDQIGVTNAGKTVAYTLTNGEWVPETGKYLKWGLDDNFDVVYPYNHSKHTVQDQSSKEKIAQADYMEGKTTLSQIPDDRTLNVQLHRQTARIIVCIKELKNQFEEREKVAKLCPQCSELDDGNLIASFAGSPYVIGDGGVGTQYVFLMSPVETFTGIVLFTSSNKRLVCKFSPTLEAGKSYTYNLSVGKDKVDVESITVEDWTDGTLPDGQGGEVSEGTPYVSFTADAAQKFKMTTKGNYEISDLWYSFDGDKWTAVVADEEVEFGGEKGSLFLRGKNVKGTAASFGEYSTITFTNEKVKVACTGDIRTLLDWEKYENVETKDAFYHALFNDCKVLTSAPALPATTLANYCYYEMFYGCSSLKTAPALPATTLVRDCYRGMFYGCSSLETPPALPATTLAYRCYRGMFEGCSSLKIAPVLPATTLVSECYFGMFEGCSSLKTASVLPATTLESYCYDDMFKNCSSLEKAPTLSAANLEEFCYAEIFYQCSKISSITMLASSSEISGKYECVFDWLNSAGTDASVTSRTLKVKDKEAYDALVAKKLPDNWKIGKCTVLDENGNVITNE